MEHDLKTVCAKLLAHCEAENWAGYEPYDALNSRIITALPFLDNKITRLGLTQVLKRSPVNVRRLLLIEKTQNPKALALFIDSLLTMSRAGVGEHEAKIDALVERLVELRSPGVSYWTWGYNFPWQTRFVLVPRWSPNLVCTAFVADAMLDLYERRQDPKYLEMARSSAQYILDELYWEKGEVAGFDYPLPACRNQVHNANFLAAALFCRAYKYSGDRRFLEPALKATRYSASQQRADGGWMYGEAASQQWIDNFHTGFNLSGLLSISRSLETGEFEGHIRKGLEFYRRQFFLEDGSVRYYHDRTYPLDTHCVAQSVITLLDLKHMDPANLPLARSVMGWAIRHMWDDRGFFYYRVLRACTIRTDYIRWTQAWMLLALARLVAQADESGSPAATATRSSLVGA